MKNIYKAFCATFITFSLLVNTLHAQSHSHTHSYPSNCIASDEVLTLTQPDGSFISVIGRGNMNNHWTETTDGYTVIRNSNGIYEYANNVNGNLIPSGVKANNPTVRSNTETTYLAGISKSIQPTLNPLKASILSQVDSRVQNKTFPTSGNVRVLALLIDYPGLNNVLPKSDFDTLLYGANHNNGDGSFKVFYETSSGGQLTIDVDVQGWYRAANNFQYYAADSGYDRAADLVREAVDAAELAGTNFSLYDNNSDGDVDGILAVHSGPGAEIGAQTGLYIWSHRWVLNGGNMGSVIYDGVRINDYMINPEVRSATNQNISGIGVFCHEFGHNLGLPDLYDTDQSNGDSEGIGNWCLMAGGAYSGNSNRPSNFSAWCKEELGWDNPTNISIGTTGIYTLNPASTTRDEIIRVNTQLPNEYFLIENRQQVGRDSDLPHHGLAIWHINTNLTNSPGNSVNADETMKGVDLEEADGLNDLDNEVNRGDSGDLFPGSSNVTTFDDNTNPSAETYLLTNTGLEIRNITETIGGSITFDFGQSPGAPCAATTTLTASSGTFDDGSGAGLDYANNQNCSWLIQQMSGTITLSFNSFDTEAGQDSVTIYDGTSALDPVLGNFSGNTIPSSITSTGSDMFITFISNATNSAPGWEASYVSSVPGTPCSGTTTLTAAMDNFSDGSGTSNYGNNLNCSWLIQPPGAASITFGLTNLATEINNDRIIVYDGIDNTAPQLGSYSGTNNLNTLTSTGGSMFVEFITNASVTDQGWDAFYTSTTSSASCSGSTTFTATTGVFSDGSMSNNYNNNQFCSWLIQPPSGQVILSFSSFATEATFDRVLVYDGADNTAPQIGNFSGNTIPAALTSSGNSLFIEFITNGTVTDQGWDASYITTGNGCSGLTTLTAPAGVVVDGSGTANYQNNLNCTWLIQPNPAPLAITFQMNQLALVGFGDRVNIYDGIDNTAPLIQAYFGTNTQGPVTAVSGSMFIEFITSANFNSQGWEGTYTSSNSFCQPNTTLTAANGTFNDGSPNGTNYIDNTDCEWLIQVPNATQVVEIDFTRFNTEIANDTVTIYNGNSAASPILGTFSGNTVPANIVSATNEVFITFKSNGSNTANGWNLQYQSIDPPTCSGQTTFIAASGTFNDGSANGVNYTDGNNCSWLITPPGVFSIDLSFNYFDTEFNFDFVTVYEGSTNSDPVLGTFSGNNIPSTISANGGAMLVEFTSDQFVNANGFEATYTSSNVPVLTPSLDTVFIDAGAGSMASFGLTSNLSWATSDNASWLLASPFNGSGNSTINLLAIQANIGPERSAMVFIDGTNAMVSDTVIVIQRTSGRFIDANPDTLNFIGQNAPGQQFSLNSNVTWNLNSASSWISFNPTTGTNVGSPTVNVTDNMTGAERSGFIVISGNLGASNDTVWVVQDTIIPPPATLSVDPMSVTLAQPMGSSGMFTVNSTTTWQTSSPASWIDIMNPAMTSDTGVVQISANSMNLNVTPRASFVAVQDVAGTLFDTVFVFQAGLTPILIGNPDTILLGSTNGSTGVLSVLATGSWTAVEGDTWFDLSQSSGNGAAMVNLTTNSDNTGSAQRVSFVALEDMANSLTDTVVVIQDTTLGSIPTLMVTPDTIRLNAGMGSTANFNISANVGWTINDGAVWHTSTPNSGNGSGVVTVNANSANTGSNERVSFVEVVGAIGAILVDTVWVIQEVQQGSLSVNPNTINLSFNSGSSATAMLTANVDWTITNPASWLSVSQLTGNSDAMLTFTANSDNLTGATRTATVTIDGVGASSITVTVNQIDGSTPSFTVSTDTVFIDAAQGSTGSFDVLANMASWSLSETTSWLLINPSSGTGVSTITALVATRNVLGVPRYATVTASANGFSDTSVVIAQLGSPVLFEALPDRLLIGSDSSDFKEFDISSNLPSWSIVKTADWLEISPQSGSFTDRITARAIKFNTSSSQRSDTVMVMSPPFAPLEVIITQDTINTIGIAENNRFEQSISLYPNPTNGRITVEIGEEFVNSNQLEAKVYNLLGEELAIDIDFSQSNTALIDLSREAKGFYFLTIRYEEAIFTRKISLIW